MKKFILIILLAYVCSFNIIQRIAKFRDEHIRLLLKKDEANENTQQPINNQPAQNITNKPAPIPKKPQVIQRSKPRGRTTQRRKKRDL